MATQVSALTIQFGSTSLCLLILQLLLLHLSRVQAQTNCSGRCCYWYSKIPGNNSECHLTEGTNVALPCNIYVPHDSNNNILGTVNWFKSANSEENTASPIDSEDLEGKYTTYVDIRLEPFALNNEESPVYQLYHDIYELTIHNISSSDSGYYWCEIQGNETCFDPSSFVNISVNTVNTSPQDNNCESIDFGRDPGICATSVCIKSTPVSVYSHTTAEPTSESSETHFTSIYSKTTAEPTSESSETHFTSSTLKVSQTNAAMSGSAPPDLCPMISVNGINCEVLIYTIPSIGVLLILAVLMICCIGLCICRRKKKRKAAKTLSKYEDVGLAEVTIGMEVPIDLATGQISQRDNEVINSASTASSAKEPPAKETLVASNTYSSGQRVSITKSSRSAITEPSMSSQIETKVEKTFQPNDLPEESYDLKGKVISTTVTDRSNKRPQSDTVDEQLPQESKHRMIIPPDHPVNPNPQRKPHQYEDIENGPVEQPNKTGDDGPMYDDIMQSTSMLQQPGASKPEEHKYHVLCSPTEMKAFKIATAATHNPEPSSNLLELHTYETVLTVTKEQQGGTAGVQGRAEGPGGLIFPEERPTVCTPKHRDHQYEKVDDDDLLLPPRDIQRETPVARESADHDVTSSGSHLYNVLANPIDSNPLQIGVVQSELPMESSMEDKYYSTAQVHRLVPIGKATESRVNEHLYQELDEAKVGRGRLASPKGDPAFNRHNTFTSSSASMIDRKGPAADQLVRTYSESVERLDPMYDEPYLVKAQTTSADTTKGVKDIYNLDTLFDDPKYAKDIKASPFFDDPKYAKNTSSHQQGTVPADKRVSQRHVSMNAGAKAPAVPPRSPVEDDEAPLPEVRSKRSRITK